jgi:hypothetical protein
MRLSHIFCAYIYCIFAVACSAPQDPAGCKPEDAVLLTAAFAAEAAPIVESKACNGYSASTCPALAPARERMQAALAAWRERCGG